MNVLFDLDGTLTDPRDGIVACIGYALQRLGQPVPAEAALEAFIGPPLASVFGNLLGPQRDASQVDRAIAAYRERFSSVGMFENVVYDGIPETLSELLRHGARLFVATSKPRVFALRILEHFELAGYFDAVYGSELDGRLSDKSDLIAHALTTSDLSSGETAMVGDRRHDMVGAARNGVGAIGALWGYGSEAELMAAGAQRLLAAPREAARLVIDDDRV